MNSKDLRTILLAEDNPADAEMAIDALREAKLANPVVHVEDGVEAMDYLLAQNGFANRPKGDPAVVLLDIKMPVMDGWSFAVEFRARYGSSTPIVVMTAAEHAAARAQEVGAKGWISKPFAYDDFVKTVRSYL